MGRKGGGTGGRGGGGGGTRARRLGRAGGDAVKEGDALKIDQVSFP